MADISISKPPTLTCPGWLKAVTVAAVIAVAAGCSRPPARSPLQRLPLRLCEGAASRPNPSVLAIGRTQDPVPRFGDNRLVLVQYQGCTLRVVSECYVPNVQYMFAPLSPTGNGSLKTLWDSAGLALNAPSLAAGIGLGLRTSESVGVEVISAGQWSARQDVVTTNMIQGIPECQNPGYVTHFVRTADVGAYGSARGDTRMLRANAGLFGYGVGGSTGSSNTRVDFAGSPNACWTPSQGPNPLCSAPVRYYLSKVEPAGTVAVCGPGQVSTQGSCADVGGTVGRTMWNINITVAAPLCSDGWGGCEVAYRISALGHMLASGRGPQDANGAGPISFREAGAALEMGIHVDLTELDEFENDYLGQCDLRFQRNYLFSSATNRTPITSTVVCGNAKVTLMGQPM